MSDVGLPGPRPPLLYQSVVLPHLWSSGQLPRGPPPPGGQVWLTLGFQGPCCDGCVELAESLLTLVRAQESLEQGLVRRPPSAPPGALWNGRENLWWGDSVPRLPLPQSSVSSCGLSHTTNPPPPFSFLCRFVAKPLESLRREPLLLHPQGPRKSIVARAGH